MSMLSTYLDNVADSLPAGQVTFHSTKCIVGPPTNTVKSIYATTQTRIESEFTANTMGECIVRFYKCVAGIRYYLYQCPCHYLVYIFDCIYDIFIPSFQR